MEVLKSERGQRLDEVLLKELLRRYPKVVDVAISISAEERTLYLKEIRSGAVEADAAQVTSASGLAAMEFRDIALLTSTSAEGSRPQIVGTNPFSRRPSSSGHGLLRIEADPEGEE